MYKKPKNDLLTIFYSALDAVSGQPVVEREILNNDYPDKFHVVAIGKAADAMLQGVPSERLFSGLLISKHGHISSESQADSRLTCIESDHPLPKQSSLMAGRALLNYLEALPVNDPCVFLISGGTSALVEVLNDGWDLEQLQALTDYLLANAYSINDINAIRRRISVIKGGGLWAFVADRPVYCLMISDVPDDDPAIIGSGLLFPSANKKLPQLPKVWQDKLSITPAIDVPEGFKWKIIASLDLAKDAAAQKATELGYQLRVVSDFIEGEASIVGERCADAIKAQPNILHIWGGESVVHLPEKPGKGGRNQHLALAAAINIAEDTNTFLLAAGTDGSDGLTSATGAIVDGSLVTDLNTARNYLDNADSNSFFKKAGGLIETGATGTNVMDLVLALSIKDKG